MSRAKGGGSATSSVAAHTEASIVPAGFEATAHPVFAQFKRPTFNAPRPPSPLPLLPSCRGSNSRDKLDSRRAQDGKGSRAFQLDPSCPICLSEPLLDPVTLCSCTHSFCLRCLERWLAVAETCPLCKGEISAFVSAAPGDHRLFTRPSETARAVQGGGAVDGLADAVAVQHALHELLAQRATSAAAADETGSTIITTSGISSASGGSTASAASVSVISSSGGSSCGSSGRSSSRGQSSESGSFSDSASSSPALPPGEPSAKRLRGAASASVVGFAPEQPTSRLAPMAARPKPVAEMLSDLGRAIVEAQTALKQLESAS